MIKGSVYQEDIMTINIYAHNIRALKYVKQRLTDIKGNIDSNTNIVRTFTSHLNHGQNTQTENR